MREKAAADAARQVSVWGTGGQKKNPSLSAEVLGHSRTPLRAEHVEHARMGPTEAIIAQTFAFVKALRQKKRSGKVKGAKRPA